MFNFGYWGVKLNIMKERCLKGIIDIVFTIRTHDCNLFTMGVQKYIQYVVFPQKYAHYI